MNKQKGFAPILVLIVAAALALAYFKIKQLNIRNTSYYPPQTPIPLTGGEKAGWKKFVNKLDGYSIEFLEDSWQINTHITSSIKCENCSGKNNGISIIKPLNIHNKEDFKNNLKEVYGKSINDPRVVEIKDTTFNNMPAVTEYNPKTQHSSTMYKIFVDNNNAGYFIQMVEKPANGSIIEQTLKTFKFIQQPNPCINDFFNIDITLPDNTWYCGSSGDLIRAGNYNFEIFLGNLNGRFNSPCTSNIGFECNVQDLGLGGKYRNLKTYSFENANKGIYGSLGIYNGHEMYVTIDYRDMDTKLMSEAQKSELINFLDSIKINQLYTDSNPVIRWLGL